MEYFWRAAKIILFSGSTLTFLRKIRIGKQVKEGGDSLDWLPTYLLAEPEERPPCFRSGGSWKKGGPKSDRGPLLRHIDTPELSGSSPTRRGCSRCTGTHKSLGGCSRCTGTHKSLGGCSRCTGAHKSLGGWCSRCAGTHKSLGGWCNRCAGAHKSLGGAWSSEVKIETSN